MARSNKVSRWYRELGRDQAANTYARVRKELSDPFSQRDPDEIEFRALEAAEHALERVRLRQIEYVTKGVKELRSFYRGFDASHGYDLRDVKGWTKQKYDSVISQISELHAKKARPHKEVVARTTDTRNLLSRYTLEPINKKHKQKKFIVHVEFPDKTEIHVTKEKGVKVIQSGTERRFFPFPRTAKTWNGVLSMARKLIKTMPPGFYRIVSSVHGPIYSPQHRDEMVNVLQSWFDAYGPAEGHAGMEETIVGFAWVASTIGAAAKAYSRANQTAMIRKDIDKKKRAVDRSRRSRRLGKRVR